jgi:predicted nucleic acid-binding Zn ribbon protein
MDALDRLAAFLLDRQVQVAGRAYPTTVHEVVDNLLPYRRYRDLLGFTTLEEYEHTLLRLLAGERGYAEAEGEARDAAARELAAVSPDLAAWRTVARRQLVLQPARIPAPPPLPPRGPAATNAPPPLTAQAPSSPPTEVDVPSPAQRFVTASELGGSCRYCSKALPDGRRLVFCPYCGQNLTTRHCPACSTELELDWKFCVTCGRNAGTPG